MLQRPHHRPLPSVLTRGTVSPCTDEILSNACRALKVNTQRPSPKRYVGPAAWQPHLTRLPKALQILITLKETHPTVMPTPEIYNLVILNCWLALQDRLLVHGGNSLEGKPLRLDQSTLAKVQNLFKVARSGRKKQPAHKKRTHGERQAEMLEGEKVGSLSGWGSLEWEVAWGTYLDAREIGIDVSRESLNILMQVSNCRTAYGQRCFSIRLYRCLTPWEGWAPFTSRHAFATILHFPLLNL